MKTKIFKMTLLLFTVIALISNAEDKVGYHIRVTWVGDAEINLIWRNPKNPDMNTLIEPLDCYDGQKEPDWGIIGQEFDNPKWTSSTIGLTNIQEVKSETLKRPGRCKKMGCTKWR